MNRAVEVLFPGKRVGINAHRLGIFRVQIHGSFAQSLDGRKGLGYIARPALAHVPHVPVSQKRNSHAVIGLDPQRTLDQIAGFLKFFPFHAVNEWNCKK